MKLTIFNLLVFCILFLEYINGQEIVDPLKGLQKLADKLEAGARSFIQDINDKFKPLNENLRKVNKKLFGNMNKAVFNAQKGLVEGLDEVIGIPVNIGDVQFYLVTSENSNDPQQIDYKDPSIVATDQGNIFFIIHGWMSSRNNSWYPRLTDILLNKFPDSHLVLLDWQKPAADSYAFAAFKTESVGNLIGDFISRLVSNYNVPLEKIILIGHSLGGQIAGWTGKKVKELLNKKLPRIIALDPAGPLFTHRPDSRRLNKHDAKVVMVVHSDGGKLGFPFSCGTIDFFPNGGSNQPGCARVNPLDINSIFDPLSCNHFRAYEYFIEALNSTGSLRGRQCASYTLFTLNRQCESIEADMGNLDEHAKGSFYLETTTTSPFAIPLKPLYNYFDIVSDYQSGNILAGTSALGNSQDSINNAGGAQEQLLVIEIQDENKANTLKTGNREVEIEKDNSLSFDNNSSNVREVENVFGQVEQTSPNVIIEIQV